MSISFEIGEENQFFLDAIEKAAQPWINDKKAELEARVANNDFPEELWKTYADLGILGCLIPEEYGGTNIGLVSQALAFEKLTVLNMPPHLLLLAAMSSAIISRAGSDALKDKYLPGIAAGDIKFCFALTEADAGTNTFAMKTKGEKVGDKYRINGSKTWISGVDKADYMIVVARTTPIEEAKEHPMGIYHGLTMFIVPADAKGIEKQKLEMGIDEGVNQYTLFLDDLEADVDQIIGEADGAAMVMFNTLNPERILAAGFSSGIGKYCLQHAVEFAKERTVFNDTPIGAHQGIAHPLTECKIQHEAARTMMLKAAWAFDSGKPATEVGSLANMSKYLCADSAMKCADTCIDTFGGAAFLKDWNFLRSLNGARLFKTVPISRAMLLNFVAEFELGLPKSY